MRSLTVIALAAAAGLLGSQFYSYAGMPPDPAPEASAPRFQLVGFTSTTFTGGEGVLGFTLACQVEFVGSRMCTSGEVMNTINVPSDLIAPPPP